MWHIIEKVDHKNGVFKGFYDMSDQNVQPAISDRVHVDTRKLHHCFLLSCHQKQGITQKEFYFCRNRFLKSTFKWTALKKRQGKIKAIDAIYRNVRHPYPKRKPIEYRLFYNFPGG